MDYVWSKLIMLREILRKHILTRCSSQCSYDILTKKKQSKNKQEDEQSEEAPKHKDRTLLYSVSITNNTIRRRWMLVWSFRQQLIT